MFRNWQKHLCLFLVFLLLLLSSNFHVVAEEYLTWGDFRYEVVTDSETGYSYVRLTGYTGHEKNLTLPAEIDGLPVECVWNLCTEEGACPQRLVIPEGIKAIRMLFELKNAALKEVVLPNSLKAIGCAEQLQYCDETWESRFEIGAFVNATSLVELTVPYTVSIISEQAFESTILLRGETGSYVARWAAANDHPFEPIVHGHTTGDLNADGKCNTTDARMGLQYAADRVTLTDEQIAVADVDGNSAVNTTDARLMLQYVAGRATVEAIAVPTTFESPLILAEQVTDVQGSIYDPSDSSPSYIVTRPYGPVSDPEAMVRYLNEQIRQEYHAKLSTAKTVIGTAVGITTSSISLSYFRGLRYYGLTFTVETSGQLRELVMGDR